MNADDTQPVTPAALQGTEVGPYRLLRSLGKGGMAEVFLAVHRHLGHLRALKVLWPEASEERATLAGRLLTEARATAKLRHPSIVEVIDCDTMAPGGAFIAMEYLRGEPAGTWLRRVGALADQSRLAAAITAVVAGGLGHAHAAGIVHRDVKPNNLLLIPDPDDRTRFAVKILDFGIAKILNEQPLVVTRGDRAIGTPYYMAPEQWVGAGAVDARTDIYSLGCLLFELLVGRPPFDRDDGMAMMHAHWEEKPERLRALFPQISEPLEALVDRMLAKEPESRPQSMEEVVVALESFLGQERSALAELLRTPDGHEVAVGADEAAAATRLGLGTDTEPAETRAEVQPARSRRRSVGLALAVATAGALAVGMALSREKPAALIERPAPVAAPAPPAPAPPAAPAVGPATPPLPASLETRPAAASPPRSKARARNVYRPVGD